jgi:hypothetical protein
MGSGTAQTISWAVRQRREGLQAASLELSKPFIPANRLHQAAGFGWPPRGS